ncbi:hypothetical protein D1BOALGB6SA_8321 [Olavius sp. associated proteobacterium Delta 1]|nr:hypothetical protein D1BOALGB6SA_8321 [Olavius sp. associated proteobacterium Delta 1]
MIKSIFEEIHQVCKWLMRVPQIFVLLLFGLIHYWHMAEAYTITPASRMNPDMSLNLWGRMFFTLWAAAPIVTWFLFLWTLISGLRLHSFGRLANESSVIFQNNAVLHQQLKLSVISVAISVSALFGAGRLALDICEINLYGGNFHMDTTHYAAFMRFINAIFVYISASYLILYRNHQKMHPDKAVGSVFLALGAIYIPSFILYFLGKSLILGVAWWFPIPDGHSWSDSQLLLADNFTLFSKWLPVIFSVSLTLIVSRRLRPLKGI